MEQQIGVALSTFSALLELGRKARRAESARELEFSIVNNTRALLPYRQAALWLTHGGVKSLSGVVQVEANAPYVLWLDGICGQLADGRSVPPRVGANDFPGPLGDDWHEWLPQYGLWLALPNPGKEAGDAIGSGGGLLLARDMPWTDQECTMLAEWVDIWHHSWQGMQRTGHFSWLGFRRRLPAARRTLKDGKWRTLSTVRWLVAGLVIAFIPVRLTVLAPGELVPARPSVIRASLDGVIDVFHVQPNQMVKINQPLFGFDEALIQTKLDVARQNLATAETEFRQKTQQALSEAKSKAQLAFLQGKIEEKRFEGTFIADQLNRARVLAPQEGMVLFDDPLEWIGRPVAIGERIMRIATPGSLEVEAWVPLADAIPLEPDAVISLYLHANPLSPVEAKLRYLAHDAVQQPDGSYAYRLRAALEGSTAHRVGLRGTAKLRGRWVPLIYWVLRRPLASLRAAIGW
ncbi:MAG: HlyD family efflux transporter periplasmic adaptor subunit [Pseudomonadota bacterium]